MSRAACPACGCPWHLGHYDLCPEAPTVDDEEPGDESWKERQDEAEEEKRDAER